jgi:hypothetical protein
MATVRFDWRQVAPCKPRARRCNTFLEDSSNKVRCFGALGCVSPLTGKLQVLAGSESFE